MKREESISRFPYKRPLDVLHAISPSITGSSTPHRCAGAATQGRGMSLLHEDSSGEPWAPAARPPLVALLARLFDLQILRALEIQVGNQFQSLEILA